MSVRKGAITPKGTDMVMWIVLGMILLVMGAWIAMGGTESVTAKIAEHSDCFKCFLSIQSFLECFPLCWML